MGYSYKKVRRSKRNNKFNKRNSKKRNSKRLASKRNKYMRGGMNTAVPAPVTGEEGGYLDVATTAQLDEAVEYIAVGPDGETEEVKTQRQINKKRFGYPWTDADVVKWGADALEKYYNEQKKREDPTITELYDGAEAPKSDGIPNANAEDDSSRMQNANAKVPKSDADTNANDSKNTNAVDQVERENANAGDQVATNVNTVDEVANVLTSKDVIAHLMINKMLKVVVDSDADKLLKSMIAENP